MLLEIVQEKRVDEDRIVELLKTLYDRSWQGKIFNDWEYNGISLCFVLTYITFHDSE
jgi:hypothetical protein